MSSYITDYRHKLKIDHYIRQATANNLWVDFSSSTLNKYIQFKGDNFCLIINGSTEINDVYIIPFKDISHLLVEKNYSPNRSRWVFRIINNILHVIGKNISFSVTKYYNAYHLLDEGNLKEEVPENESTISREIITWDQDSLTKLIKLFNERYLNISPSKKITISERIARPGPISDYLKKLNNYRCQLCMAEGFIQKSTIRYAETHHIIELHKLIQGSFCSDNIIVVCPTCHKKLHYANTIYSEINNKKVQISINNKVFTFNRNVIS